MLDSILIPLIISVVNDGLAAAGLTGLKIKQAVQPTLQGANTAPTAYLTKIGDHAFGSPRRADVYNITTELFDHIETQQYETTFQFTVWATQNPNVPNEKTASDIANLLRYIMQSSATINALEAQGVGIYRVTEIRNPYFKDDREQFEACPSFDFQLTHKQVITTTTPVVVTAEYQILTV